MTTINFKPMKIFISWSGEKSRRVAELFNEWIQCVIQAVKPWMSSHDIERDALWFSEISNTLANTQIGIICLTQTNKIQPWILFEAGALAKGIDSNRVCTLLIDLEPTDIENPLAQFNHTIAKNKDSMWELVKTINHALLDNGLQEKVLNRAFETYWPQFIEEFKTLIRTVPDEEKTPKRKNDDVLIDILSTVRTLDRRIRDIEIRSEILPNQNWIKWIDPDKSSSSPQIINVEDNIPPIKKSNTADVNKDIYEFFIKNSKK